jgi:hypothetical protein
MGLTVTLPGCGELRLGRALEGVPEVADADVPIRRALDGDAVFPNLADVPERPASLPDAVVLRTRLEALQSDIGRASADRAVLTARGEGIAAPPAEGPDRIPDGYRPPAAPSLGNLRPPDAPRMPILPEATGLIPGSPVSVRGDGTDSPPRRDATASRASQRPIPPTTVAAAPAPVPLPPVPPPPATPPPAAAPPSAVAPTPAATPPSAVAPTPAATPPSAVAPTPAAAPPPAVAPTPAVAPVPAPPPVPAVVTQVAADPAPPAPPSVAQALRDGSPLPPPRPVVEDPRIPDSGVRAGPPAFRTATPGPEEVPAVARLMTAPPAFDRMPMVRPPPAGRPTALTLAETAPLRPPPVGPQTGPLPLSDFRPAAGDSVTEQVAIFTFDPDQPEATEGDGPLLARIAAAQMRLGAVSRIVSMTPREPRPSDVARARARAQSLAATLIRLGAPPGMIFVGIAEGATGRSGDRAEIYLDYAPPDR